MDQQFFEKMNEQMNFELESAYIYKTMAAYLDSLDLAGMTHFMDEQVKEEVEHSEDFKHIIQDLGYTVKWRPLDPGEGKFESVLDVFKTALDHEKEVSRRIAELHDEAYEKNYRAAGIFLDKYIMEQVEEEDTFSTIVTRLERIGDSWSGLYIFDGELGQR